MATLIYVSHWVNMIGRWQALAEDGSHCLHLHKTQHGADKCAKGLNRPTRHPLATPQGAYEHAAGYQN